jgi:NAD dependent epimerase/dehydratase
MTTTVAVTGADGFIGSHLVEQLVASGCRVRAMVQYNSLSSWGWLDEVNPEVMTEVEVVPGDVRDRNSVYGLMKGAGVVYHLAALIAIPYSYQAPRSYLDTNVVGTMNVLDVARQLGTTRVVHTSTSEVYGTAQTVPIKETHPLQAQSPYSASKIAADKLVESYWLSFRTPVVTVRPFNTFGPRQSARAVIPTVISQIAAGRRVISLGALDPTRDFNYVADTAAAFVAIGQAPAEAVAGGVFNVGSGREISVENLVHLVSKLMNADVEVVLDSKRLRPETSEVMRLVCDRSLVSGAVGWHPCHSLEDGLEETIDWFRDPRNLRRYRTDQYNV